MDLDQHLQLILWFQAAQDVASGPDGESPADETATALFELMIHHGWVGACHSTACILTVLFREQGLIAQPYIGECQYPGTRDFTDHSWVETEGGIYDLAVALPWPGQGAPLPPVLAGRAVAPHDPEMFVYGSPSGKGYGEDAAHIKSKSILEYMDEEFDDCPRGKWQICVNIGASIGLELSVDALREKYRNLAWRERPLAP